MPAYSGTAVAVDTPGTTLERHPRLRARRGVSGRVAEHEADRRRTAGRPAGRPWPPSSAAWVGQLSFGIGQRRARLEQVAESARRSTAVRRRGRHGRSALQPVRSGGSRRRAGADERDPAGAPARPPHGSRTARPPCRSWPWPACRPSRSWVWGSLVIVPAAEVSAGHCHIPSRASAEQIGGHLAADLLSLRQCAARAAAKRHSPVGRDDYAAAAEVLPCRQHTRRPAPSSLPEARRADCVLPSSRPGSPGSSMRAEQRNEIFPARAALNRQRALARGRDHLVRLEHLRHGVEPADPGQPRVTEHDGVQFPGLDLRQPGSGIAADRERAARLTAASAAAPPGGASPCRSWRRPAGPPAWHRLARPVHRAGRRALARRLARSRRRHRSAGPSASARRNQLRPPASSPASNSRIRPVPPI